MSFISILILSFMLAVTTVAVGQDNISTRPILNQGKKWRIGYLEGRSYSDYETTLKAIVRGLINLGWIEDFSIPSTYNPDHREFWQWLAANAKSDYIEFVPDAFWTSESNENRRPETKRAVLARLNKNKDIDLMIAVGTWAGQDLANNDHSVPTVVVSTTDPVGANIIKSVEDSGYDHIHAKVDPLRYERQVRIFHDIMNFSKLGIVYDNSSEGRTSAGIDAIEKVARKIGFAIVPCFAPSYHVSQQVADKGVVACYTELAAKVDAAYITVHRGVRVNAKNLSNVLAPLLANKIPTFSMLGSDEVRRGVLMGIAQAEFKYVGQFHAEIIAKIFNGVKPRDLTQEWSDPPKIAINLETARKIGYDPPFDVLMAADEIYLETEGENNPDSER